MKKISRDPFSLFFYSKEKAAAALEKYKASSARKAWLEERKHEEKELFEQLCTITRLIRNRDDISVTIVLAEDALYFSNAAAAFSFAPMLVYSLP